jgi:hypothetical protein
MPGALSGRVFVCACCQAEVLVCSRCDRGQRYCGIECRQRSRRAAQQEAGRRYQSSRAGRFSHARRARRYRHRCKPPPPKIVTHQGSQAPDTGDVLQAGLGMAPAIPSKETLRWNCHWCARCCSSVVRRGFLPRGREPAHGASP